VLLLLLLLPRRKVHGGKGCGGSGAATFTFRLRVGGWGFRVSGLGFRGLDPGNLGPGKGVFILGRARGHGGLRPRREVHGRLKPRWEARGSSGTFLVASITPRWEYKGGKQLDTTHLESLPNITIYLNPVCFFLLFISSK
jgi:hypothetical protein